ncbi:MAG: hypothetical protein AAGF95_19715 [Chloroflexota bacterium]
MNPRHILPIIDATLEHQNIPTDQRTVARRVALLQALARMLDIPPMELLQILSPRSIQQDRYPEQYY